MRFTSHTAAVTLLTLLGAAGVSSAQQPKNFNQEFRKVQTQVQAKQYPQSLKQLDGMLKTFTEAEETKAIQQLRLECMIGGATWDAAIALADQLVADYASDKAVVTDAKLAKARALVGKGDFEKAVALFRQIAKDHADRPTQAATALLEAGDVQANSLKKPDDAVATWTEAEKSFAAQPALAAEAARRAAVTLETLVKDPVRAAAMYQKLPTTYAEIYDLNNRSGFFTKAIELYAAAGKLPEAQAAAAQAEKAIESVPNKTTYALRQVDLLLVQKKHPEARAEATRLICAYPLESDTCQQAQARIVETYRAESKFDDCLGAARVLYDASGTEAQIRAAAQVVAQGFRSVDGNLGRANEFLVYQRFGPNGQDQKPGTPDDLAKNHLAAVKPPADPAADKSFQAAVAAQTNTFEGYRAKGYLNAYWGKPKECAQNFYLAFKSCPDASVPAVATELVLIGMKAHRSSFAGLEEIFEFISYGPAGKDGKQKIADPFAGL